MTDEPAPSPTAERGTPRWFAPALIFCGLAFLATAGVLVAMLLDARDARLGVETAGDPFAGLAVPEFGMTDHRGEPVDATLFDGGHHVLAFVFSNCPLACPAITAAMIRVEAATRDADVGFVCVSVDPTNDTPERLAEHASALGADGPRWSWLSGEPGQVERVLAGLGMTIDTDPSVVLPVAGGGTMANIVHPTRLVLIRPDRSVAGLFSTQSPGDRELDALVERIGRLAPGR